jgi:hypothetical protein
MSAEGLVVQPETAGTRGLSIACRRRFSATTARTRYDRE